MPGGLCTFWYKLMKTPWKEGYHRHTVVNKIQPTVGIFRFPAGIKKSENWKPKLTSVVLSCFMDLKDTAFQTSPWHFLKIIMGAEMIFLLIDKKCSLKRPVNGFKIKFDDWRTNFQRTKSSQTSKLGQRCLRLIPRILQTFQQPEIVSYPATSLINSDYKDRKSFHFSWVQEESRALSQLYIRSVVSDVRVFAESYIANITTKRSFANINASLGRKAVKLPKNTKLKF